MSEPIEGQIKKVTIEYDKATYIAEGEDAVSWRKWMLQAEEQARQSGLWIWNNWTTIKSEQSDSSVLGRDGPLEPPN